MADRSSDRLSGVLGFFVVAIPVAIIVAIIFVVGVLPRVASGDAWPAALVLTAVGFVAAFGFWYSAAGIRRRGR